MKLLQPVEFDSLIKTKLHAREIGRCDAIPARWSIVKALQDAEARLNSGTNYEFLKVANLPCLLIGGVHEWANKIPTVPTTAIEPVSRGTDLGATAGREDPEEFYFKIALSFRAHGVG